MSQQSDKSMLATLIICLLALIAMDVTSCFPHPPDIGLRQTLDHAAPAPETMLKVFAPPVVKTGNAVVDTAAQDAADARAERDALAERLATAEAKVKRMDANAAEAKRQADLEHLQSICSWIAGLCLLAAVGMLVAAFFLPLGRGWLLSGAAGCGGGLVLALTLRQVLPWLAVGGLAIGLLLAAVGVVLLIRRYHGALLAAIDHGERMEEAAGGKTQAIVQGVLKSSLAQQVEGGVQKLIKKVRGK